MPRIHVSVVSPEEASNGNAEFWCGRELAAVTVLENGQLQLRIDPRPDGSVFYGGENKRLAIQAQNGMTCTTNPPNMSSIFVTRGLMGFPASANAVKKYFGDEPTPS